MTRNTAEMQEIITSFSSVQKCALSNGDGVVVIVLYFKHWFQSTCLFHSFYSFLACF